MRAGPQSLDVEALLDETDVVITTQDVVAETFTAIAKLAKDSAPALAWWNALAPSPIQVASVPSEEIRTFANGLKIVGRLSFADLSLGVLARQERITAAATGDREFRRMGLEPLFAKP